MYDNIGGKIKGLAKAMFIVEAIVAVIAGIVSFTADDDFILVGLLTLFCGPIVAWVSSWILYAFGELVEDIHAMRKKELPLENDAFDEEKVNIENNDEENVETFDSIQEKCQLLSEGDIKTKNGVLKKYYGNNKYIIIPDNITGIERDSFEFADNLIGVIMHDSITNIGSYAFNGCKNLSTVILSKGITTLKVGTFSGCYSLANIMIPASVTYIERDAFENCGKFIVHTVEGSYAEKFARENGVEVTLI